MIFKSISGCVRDYCHYLGGYCKISKNWKIVWKIVIYSNTILKTVVKKFGVCIVFITIKITILLILLLNGIKKKLSLSIIRSSLSTIVKKLQNRRIDLSCQKFLKRMSFLVDFFNYLEDGRSRKNLLKEYVQTLIFWRFPK